MCPVKSVTRVLGRALRVARAVEASHPRRAMEIYLAELDRLIERKKPELYAQAAALLKTVGRLMGTRRRSQWLRIVERIRLEHARKRRSMKELERLTRSPVQMARRRRS